MGAKVNVYNTAQVDIVPRKKLDLVTVASRPAQLVDITVKQAKMMSLPTFHVL